MTALPERQTCLQPPGQPRPQCNRECSPVFTLFPWSTAQRITASPMVHCSQNHSFPKLHCSVNHSTPIEHFTENHIVSTIHCPEKQCSHESLHQELQCSHSIQRPTVFPCMIQCSGNKILPMIHCSGNHLIPLVLV